jgi:hypothetical protein
MKKIILLVISVCFLQACKNDVKTTEDSSENSTTETPTEQTTAQKIANANGFDTWKDVSEISFTFNVDREDNHYERTWSWNPKSNEVVMVTPNGRVEFDRDSLTEKTRGADAGFINDKYWLMAPFHLITDEGTTTSEEENVTAPLSKTALNKITLTYGQEGGYTPGDAYDFYYDTDYMVKEWTFRKGNDTLPTMMTTWEDYEDFNGLKLAKMHQDSTGGFKLYFTNITVK